MYHLIFGSGFPASSSQVMAVFLPTSTVLLLICFSLGSAGKEREQKKNSKTTTVHNKKRENTQVRDKIAHISFFSFCQQKCLWSVRSLSKCNHGWWPRLAWQRENTRGNSSRIFFPVFPSKTNLCLLWPTAWAGTFCISALCCEIHYATRSFQQISTISRSHENQEPLFQNPPAPCLGPHITESQKGLRKYRLKLQTKNKRVIHLSP